MNRLLSCLIALFLSRTLAAGQAIPADLGKTINALATKAGTAAEVSVPPGGGVISSVISLQSGHVLRFGPGTYVVAGIDLPDSSTSHALSAGVECAGIDKTILKLSDGANRSVITNKSFASLTGTKNYFGAFRASIRNCTIDGNRSHNTKGAGIRLYGRGLQIENVHVQNASEEGVYTEWNGESRFAKPEDDLEASVSNLKTMFNGGNGMTSKGPHDLVVRGFTSYQNGKWGWDIQTPLHAMQINSYLNKGGGCWTHVLGTIVGADVMCNTASGIGLLVDDSGGPAVLSAAVLTGPV